MLARRNSCGRSTRCTQQHCPLCLTIACWSLEFLERCLCCYSLLRVGACRKHAKSYCDNSNEHRALFGRFPACCGVSKMPNLLVSLKDLEALKHFQTFLLSEEILLQISQRHLQSSMALIAVQPFDSFNHLKLSNGFSNPLINFALFLEMGACASPSLPWEIPAPLVLSEKQECLLACHSSREYSCLFYSNKCFILWSSLLS